MMIELTSTPIIIMVILGVAGMIIPVINVLRKERGSSTFYGLIAFGALLLSLGYVIYRFYTDSVADSAIFSSDVLVDDGFGSFFAIAMLIVSIMAVAGSFNYMRKRSNPAIYFSLILTFKHWYGANCIFNRPGYAICCMGVDEYSNIHPCRI